MGELRWKEASPFLIARNIILAHEGFPLHTKRLRRTREGLHTLVWASSPKSASANSRSDARLVVAGRMTYDRRMTRCPGHECTAAAGAKKGPFVPTSVQGPSEKFMLASLSRFYVASCERGMGSTSARWLSAITIPRFTSSRKMGKVRAPKSPCPTLLC